MKKKLTYRQQEFLGQFLDEYQEMGHSLHYGAVAERLGINKITAYDMLRLLEEHNLVRSEYQPTIDQHGPGRPAVLFYPAREAEKLLAQLASPSSEQDDWEEARKQILQKLKDGKVAGYEELLQSLLNRIPEKRSPLIYLPEFITSVILSLKELQDSAEINAVIDRLRRIGLPQEITLSVFSGVGLLLLVMEKSNRATATFLLSQMNRYEGTLMQINEDGRRQLHEYTREVLRIIFG